MTQKLRYFCTLLLMAVVSVAWADEVVYKTALFGANYNSQGVSSYTTTWTATNDGFTVTLENFNNNGNGWDYVKCGRKNNASVATITTGVIDEAITKVDVTIDAITAAKVNSIKLYISSDNSNWDEAGSFDKSTGAKTVTLANPAADLYYKIEFDCASGSSNGLVTVSKVELYYDDSATPSTNPSISAENVSITYDATGGEIAYELTNPVTGGSMSAETASDWLTLSGTNFDSPIAFTCSANDGAERTATVTLTYSYDNQSVTKNVTVTQAGNPNRPGTENNPYTVAQAIQAIDDANQGTVSDVYVAGIVSQVDSYNNGQITYWISDDGTTTNQFEVYRGKGIGGANFTSQNDVKVGDEVVVKGNITYYANGGVYEFAANNQLVSLNRPVSTTPTVTVAQTAVNVVAAGGDGTINVTYENFSQNTDISVQIQDETGAPTTFGWFDADIDNNNNVYYLVDSNTDTAERKAYLRVMVADLDAKEVYYSDVITITQEAYVAPSYATLPFSFNSGRSDIEGTEGLSHNGLGTDYNATSAPNTRLKFDSTGDWLLLEFNEEPGILSFDVKGNSFSGGTFKVQTSEDGVTFTDLASYTELGDAATKAYDLDANVRCVKWIYTEKVSGNVGLGNIVLEKSGATVSLTIKQGFTATTFSCDKALDFTGQNIQAYIITDENGTTQAVTTVPANTGLYIEGAAGDYQIPMIASAPAITGNKLEATDGTTTLYSDNNTVYYAFGKQNGKEAFYKVPTSGFTPSANKAVLAIDAVNGAKEMIVIGGDVTGIESIENGTIANDNYYTIDGKLVKGQPTQKGIYVVNGRKVVIK